MKTATLVLAASLAGAAVAQLGNLPSCATSCLTKYTSGGTIAGCNSVDINCICSNSSFLSGIACCLAGTCSESDQVAATKYAESLCRSNGVTNLPASVTCASTSSQAPTSSASTGGATSSPSSAATTTGSATGAAATTTPAGSSTASSSAAASSSTGAAVQNIAAMGAGLAGGLAAVAALL